MTEGYEATTERLQGEFPRWKIWRSTSSDGTPSRLWCATRLDVDAGVDPTVICESAEQLAAELREQADDPRRGADVLGRWP